MRSKSEPTPYIKIQYKETLIISLYVDDLIYIRNNEKMMHEFKEDMMETFEMIDLCLMHYFLGIEIRQQKEEIFRSQKKYTKISLEKFRMNTCKLVTTPFMTNVKLSKEDGFKKANDRLYRNLIESLLYLIVIRPDVMYTTSLFSKFI